MGLGATQAGCPTALWVLSGDNSTELRPQNATCVGTGFTRWAREQWVAIPPVDSTTSKAFWAEPVLDHVKTISD